MSEAELYGEHLRTLDRILSDALERSAAMGQGFDAVLFHAGCESFYFADDRPIVFRETPHFKRYVPLRGPEHCLLARPGRRPLLVRVAPRDYWFEILAPPPSYWQQPIDMIEVADAAEVPGSLGLPARTAYVGPSARFAALAGIDESAIMPKALVAALDWHRAYKTPHEVRLIERACALAAEGHRVARKAFESGATEREIHWAYLAATDHIEADLPFETIVARGSKIAILHYQNKRHQTNDEAPSFMLDAGASFDGYASDVTRTWFTSRASADYRALVIALDLLQRRLVSMVAPGQSYVGIHEATHAGVAEILASVGIVRCSAAEALESGVTRSFLPHGVGHHLGIQVHDVGGRQIDPDGTIVMPPPHYPALRTTRPLEAGHVVTIEPGLYFVPVLLEALKSSPAGALVNWNVVESLAPYGGVRIEDDVLCEAGGSRDLTRGLIQGPRGE